MTNASKRNVKNASNEKEKFKDIFRKRQKKFKKFENNQNNLNCKLYLKNYFYLQS